MKFFLHRSVVINKSFKHKVYHIGIKICGKKNWNKIVLHQGVQLKFLIIKRNLFINISVDIGW